MCETPRVPRRVEELKRTCRKRNEEPLGTLREDKLAQYLLDQTLADAECGRMTKPVGVDELNLDNVLLGRRCSREQGTKPDGATKL